MPLTNFQPERVLQYQLRRIFEGEYKPLHFREFLPVNHEVPPGAEGFVTYLRDKAGSAGLIKRGRPGEFPPVSASTSRAYRGILEFGDMFEYSINELRQSQLPGGLPLNTTLMTEAQWFCEKQLDDVAASGFSATGWTGITNDANVPLTSITGAWLTTPANIIPDTITLYNAVVNNTEENHEPNVFIVPTLQWGKMNEPRSTTSDTTIRQFLEANLGIKIVRWNKFDQAGAGSVDRVVMGDFSSDVLEFFISQEFETTEPQLRAKVYEVYGSVRTGGLQVRFPRALTYGDGV